MTDLTQFEPIAEAVATLFHPYVEVVIHDVEQNRVAAIYNNYSKREVGAESHLNDQELDTRGAQVRGPFEKRSFDGHRVKYTSAVLRDSAGQPVALMCINVDLHVFDQIGSALEMFLGRGDAAGEDALFEDDWHERINAYVHDYLRANRLTLARLGREERLELVGALRAAGAFRAKNAVAYAANVIGVSRATVYNDLSKLDSE